MVLWERGGQLEQISQNSPLYAALHYVLLFLKEKNKFMVLNWENERRIEVSQIATY